MADRREHRGPHPEDGRLFGEGSVGVLREAVGDLAWLLGRGYADRGAVKLVGDRYRLEGRQRAAVVRSCCSDGEREFRLGRKVGAEAVEGEGVVIDGYNVLTTLEVALGGGMVLKTRDGAHRDIAGIHGTWRKTVETPGALELVGRVLGELKVGWVRVLLDRPVSNSGRLAGMMREAAERNRWGWEVELVGNPDGVLMESEQIVCTADSVILDAGVRWFDLVGEVIGRHVRGAWVVDLG